LLACSSLRQERTGRPPGSAQGLYLIVSDIDAPAPTWLSAGVAMRRVFTAPARRHPSPTTVLVRNGAASSARSQAGQLGSYASFQGSGRQRLAFPGDHRAIAWTRDPSDTTFTSQGELAARASSPAAAQCEHES